MTMPFDLFDVIETKAVDIDMVDEIGKLTLKVTIESNIDVQARMDQFDDGVPIFHRIREARIRMRIAAQLIKVNRLIGWLTGMEVKLFEYDPGPWDRAMDDLERRRQWQNRGN
jgi:hypothetical protein